MAVICPRCKSTETQALIHNQQCLTCGGVFGFDGEPQEHGMDESTRTALQARLEPRVSTAAGNIADLMRSGRPENAPPTPHKLITPQEMAEREGVSIEPGGQLAGGDNLTSTASVQPKQTRRK